MTDSAAPAPPPAPDVAPAPDADPEPGPRDGASPWLRVLHRHRRAIGTVFALWIALVLGGGVFLSTLDARTGLHVFGPRAWVAGEPGVLRVGLRDLQRTGFEPVAAVEAWFLPRPEGDDPQGWPPPTAAELASGGQRFAQRAEDFVQGAVVPPAPGAWRLHLLAESERGPITVDLAVDVQPAGTPPAPPRPRKPEHPLQPDTGPIRLDLFPTDHALPGDLPTSLTVRATDAAGRPVATSVGLTVREGHGAVPVPAVVHTDHLGLARFAYKGQTPRLWIDLVAPAPETAGAAPDPAVPAAPADPPPAGAATDPGAAAAPDPSAAGAPEAGAAPTHSSRATRRLQRTPTQHVLDLPARPVAPEAEIPIQIERLQRQAGTVFVDAWLGDRWVAASTLPVEGGIGAGTLRLPAGLPDPAVLWIQAYGGAYLPQQARAGRYLVVGSGPGGPLLAFAARSWAAAGIDAAWIGALPAAGLTPDALQALLGRADRPDGDPPLLANSTDSVRQTVAALKRRWQRRLILALLGTGLLLLGGLAWVVAQSDRQVRTGWAAAGGDDEGDPGTRAGRLREALPLFVILALFLWGLVFVLLQIHW